MKVVATLTSKFGTHGYKSAPVSEIAAYMAESALDTDADQWSIDIGDPSANLVALLKRDNEVRVRLAAQTRGGGLQNIMRGYADLIVLTHDGRLALQGRDLSAAPVDTTAEPQNWHMARPDKIIVKHARVLGFGRFNVPRVKPLEKFFTDGSETEWAMWYRMIRKKQMWIWTDADGTLHIDHLNYNDEPAYYFGKPTRAAGKPNANDWIPVQTSEIRKNTQTRIGNVWVFGEGGKNKIGFKATAHDPKIKEWIKKPLKIITADSTHTNQSEALKEAHEEIFESIVGSIEITILISDPGFIVQQDEVAYLNLPNNEYRGEFFVVGVQVRNGTEGSVQEIRLREKKYALTRRIPDDPKLNEGTESASTSALGSSLGLSKAEWGEYFVQAAKDWHGGYDFALFLAVLLAICEKETGFINEREGGRGKEWTPEPSGRDPQAVSPGLGITITPPKGLGSAALQEWKKDFANAAGNPLNPFGREAGVGPMQLTSAGFKKSADARVGIHDEYQGGRWHPSANIWVAAQALSGKLSKYPPSEANIWLGVRDYNGSGPAAEAYMRDVRKAVLGHWLPQVQQELKDQKNVLPANSTKTLKDLPNNTPNSIRKAINFAERQEGKPYGWGAAGPDKWDCSGLVFGAYHAAGLSDQIGGRQTTYGYWANGKGYGNLFRVAKDELLPGDMVFFNNIDHMGLYYGDGQMIVAPHTGDVVKVESINGRGLTWEGALRLKGVWPANRASVQPVVGHGPDPLK